MTFFFYLFDYQFENILLFHVLKIENSVSYIGLRNLFLLIIS